MNLTKVFALQNAGDLLARKRAVDRRLRALKTAFENAAPEESGYLLGKISAVEDHRDSSHKKIVTTLVHTRQEIRDAVDFPEEQTFLKGYLAGLETVLQLDRELFQEERSFILFLYAEDPDLREKYALALAAMDAFTPLCGQGLQYFLTGDAAALEEAIRTYGDSSEFLVTVLYGSGRLPSVETMRTLSAGRAECICLHKDTGTENLADILYKLLKTTAT